MHNSSFHLALGKKKNGEIVFQEFRNHKLLMCALL